MIPETLTIVERQILANQYRILSKLGDHSQDYETKIEILESGFTEQYYEVFDLDVEEIPLEICTETTQILHMYKRINDVVAALTEEEKTAFDLEKIKFKGFNPRKDAHYHYMSFTIDTMGLWPEYKDIDLIATDDCQLSKYRRMLDYQIYLLDNDQYDLTKENLYHLIDLAVNLRMKKAI